MVTKDFNIVIVAQAGRLQYEAVLFLSSLRQNSPLFKGKVFVAEPIQGPLWQKDPKISSEGCREALHHLGATFISFENKHFGGSYPYGNKIECLKELPPNEPFVFFDTDTLICGELCEVPFDFARPSASLRREGTWPVLELYGPGYTDIWKSLYDMFGLDFESSLDLSYPDEYWKRYLYFNAGFFYYKCPKIFGNRLTEFAVKIRDDRPEALRLQSFDPWLDQVTLPLVIHSLNGSADALPSGYLDGITSCHYRYLPLLYGREKDAMIACCEAAAAPNKIKKALKENETFRRFIYQGRGKKVRDLFDQENLPRRERAIRNRIKSAGLWMR